MMKDVTETKKMKKMMLTAGITAMLQSGLILEKEGKAMMKEEEMEQSEKSMPIYELLTFEIQNDENFTHEKLLQGLKKREFVSLKEYKKESSAKKYSIQTLIDSCLQRINNKDYNCGDDEANRYEKFINIVSPVYVKLNENNQTIIRFTLLEIFRYISY